MHKMYRGTSNPDYHRPPVPPSGFGHPAASFGPPPFCPPFGVPLGPRYCAPPPGPPPGRPYGAGNENYNRESFYENRPFTSHTADQSGSSLISSLLTSSNQHQLGHTSQNWSTQSLDEQNQEVRKKAQEFLRILEASDWIELPGDKNDNGDRTADKHPSRTRSRSRGRSRPRSRSRSRGRSRGRSQARSRGKSRARSKTRSRSRNRGKSRTRAKSRARSRSRSRSHGKSGTHSKSQSRLSPSQTKHSSRGTTEGNHSSSSASSGISHSSSAMPDVFHGLKQILQNKDLDKHLPLVKNALLRSQNADDTRGMFLENQYAGFQNLEPEASAELRYGSMLPHERAGGDSGSFSNILSWNTPNQQPETKPAFQSVEDEEKFLYGEEEERSKPQAVTVPLAQTRSVRSPVHHLSKEHQTHGLQEPKAHAMPASVPPAASGTTKVTPEECEKVKTLLRTIGLNPGMADICKMAARLKEKKEEQGTPASLLMLKPTLEALQALSRATKTKDSNRSGSSHSNHDSKREEKTDEKERDRREKQIQKKRKEYLVKELEGLLKQEGEGGLIPVMGFFCQRCEEFFGDLNSAERHVESHSRKDRNKTTGSQEQHRDAKRHEDQNHTSSHRRESPHSRSSRVYQDHKERSPDRKRTRDERIPHSTDIKLKNEPEGKDSKDESKDKEKKDKTDDDDDAESTKSEKKKKKKEKKMKKKEKKRKKDKEKKKGDKDSP
ncbi:serine/arginine repetitive matrix protein 2-like isoform X2 [Cyprinus carpio]|uniref:Serine/arginine repetitive matrix protein 2-like isoform X2 n=1 Tax=Cyprinus carpio TaxID=7962 RepID=A0A9Q9XAB2_CYPCA|nr:serine/arginine repetitive matrix protein 2-like isoform X2 [Cyprinus carpio]